MNRKQKAMEERYRNTATPKYANPNKNTSPRRMYEPTAEVRLAIRKRNKLAELLKDTDEAVYSNDFKREATYLLSDCARHNSLEEWNVAQHNNGFFFLFGQAQKPIPAPTKRMKFTWDVHTGVALTKLYNSLY